MSTDGSSVSLLTDIPVVELVDKEAVNSEAVMVLSVSGVTVAVVDDTIISVDSVLVIKVDVSPVFSEVDSVDKKELKIDCSDISVVSVLDVTVKVEAITNSDVVSVPVG